MKKSILVILVAIFVFTALFVGCSGNTSEDNAEALAETENTTEEATDSDASNTTDTTEEPEEVEISWLVWETDNLTPEVYDNIIANFNNEFPHIKITKEKFAGTDREQYIKTLYATGRMPDIITGGIRDIQGIDGALKEVPEDIVNLIQDGMLSRYNDKVVSVPTSRQVKGGVFYNEQIFNQYNINVPETWGEFVNACETLKNNGETPIIASGPDMIWATGFMLSNHILTSSLRTLSPDYMQMLHDGTLSWNGPEVKEMVLKWKGLIDSGYYHDGSYSFKYSQAVDEFFKGNAAMMVNGGWMAADADKAEKDFEVGFFPVPAPDKAAYYSANTGEELAVAGVSQHENEAFEFIRFLITDEDTYKLWLKSDGNFYSTVNPVNYEYGNTLKKVIDGYEGLEATTNVLNYQGALAPPTGFIKIIHQFGQNIFLGADVDKELDELQKQWDELKAQ